jgi:hypothetical protein
VNVHASLISLEQNASRHSQRLPWAIPVHLRLQPFFFLSATTGANVSGGGHGIVHLISWVP